MTSNGAHWERLDFVLPDFLRLAWVNEPAREIWAARFQKVMQAWAEMEWLSAAAGIRNCALTRVSKRNYETFATRLEARGVRAAPLIAEENSQESQTSLPSNGRAPGATLQVIAPVDQDFAHLTKVLNSSDHEEIGSLLGYPPCCRNAFRQRCREESFWDPTWQTALETAHDTAVAPLVELEEEPVANLLLRWVGIRAIPHLPCRFDCDSSIELGRRFLDLGIESGFRTEMEWLEEILSWPTEWSALHGIAEIKTPVLKVCTRTEATANKLVLRWKGSRYPAEGAKGLVFPYRTPPRPLMTGSPSFQRALEHHSSIVQIQPLAKQSG